MLKFVGISHMSAIIMQPFKAKTVGADLYEGLNSICPGQNSALHSEADCHSLIVIPLFRRLTGDLAGILLCSDGLKEKMKYEILKMKRRPFLLQQRQF
ncbi:Hypothetical protein NTJ_08836 [Nesidiocoris tenuis]|uniref:GAF domain-containing protein n=1 Tax=Nesidiocoris tenuis TaxID=355587 RepID=A0ABN7AUZ9_9HEMI|nr:Hypothetical protein NTJ_08836 [Nesidiocoris tenuis]